MPVYTVHAPMTSNVDLRATDRFTFVRDGFHVWAALFGPLWLAWHRLWLALIGWVALLLVLDVAMVRLSVGSAAIFIVGCLLALLLGFEAASIERWTLSRRNWRQLEIVVADDAEAAERRFFDRWTARQRAIGDDQRSVERGAPPPTREVPGQAFSRPPSREDIIGLFPEPGASH